MITIRNIKTILVLTLAFGIFSCSSYKGSASDKTGTNGATNGTGKIAK